MKPFRAALTSDRASLQELGECYTLPTVGNVGSFHYGDAPSHCHGADGCAGNTMNIESIRVLEFWQREGQDWVRHPEYELYIGEQDHEGPTLDDL